MTTLKINDPNALTTWGPHSDDAAAVAMRALALCAAHAGACSL